MNEASPGEQDVAEELYAHRDDPDEWEEEATHLEVRATGTEVVSFRLPSEALDRLQLAAEQRGETLSEILRDIVLSTLKGKELEQLIDFTAGSGQVTVRTSLSSGGSTENPALENMSDLPDTFELPDFPPRTAGGDPHPPHQGQ